MTGKIALRWAFVVAAAWAVACARASAEEDEPGYMGVQLRAFELGEADEVGFDREHGMIVQVVVPGSPAEKAGLRAGDVLTRLGRQPCEDYAHVREAMADTHPGSRIGFAAWRDGRMFEGEITLGARPEDPQPGEREPDGAEARFRAAQAERREVDARREKLEGAIRETRTALLAAADQGREGAVRELAGKLVDFCREAGRLQVRAEMLADHAAELERRVASRDAEGDAEREAAMNQIEVMRLAMRVVGERGAALLERKVHAIEMGVAGRRDAEAREVIEAAPPDGAMAELLLHAAELYRRQDAPDRADLCERLGRQFQERWRRKREQEERSASREGDDAVAGLERRLREIQEAVERLQHELDGLRR